MSDLKKWKLLGSKLAFDNKWCRVRQDEVELPNGIVIDDFFVNVRPDIALVFAVTPQEEIVFVRQYRHGVAKILWELPAGRFNQAEETGESAAVRELAEETGYVAAEIIQLAILYDNPVNDTNSTHLFFAKNVENKHPLKLDVTEEIEVVLIPVSEVMEKITSQELCVSGTIAAIFLGLEFLRKLKDSIPN